MRGHCRRAQRGRPPQISPIVGLALTAIYIETAYIGVSCPPTPKDNFQIAKDPASQPWLCRTGLKSFALRWLP
ncbi:unnamed protein product [Peniophora sp. CBMAI 1063]|nr:unnamed protein product [Peniophora sp. CBMAI 1063]